MVGKRRSEPDEAAIAEIDAIVARDIIRALAIFEGTRMRGLARELDPSETLLQIACAAGPRTLNGLFALTDERVIFARRRLLRRSCVAVAIDLVDVQGVEPELTGDILLLTLELRDGRRREYYFARAAENREAIYGLLQSLPAQRRALVEGGSSST